MYRGAIFTQTKEKSSVRHVGIHPTKIGVHCVFVVPEGVMSVCWGKKKELTADTTY